MTHLGRLRLNTSFDGVNMYYKCYSSESHIVYSFADAEVGWKKWELGQFTRWNRGIKEGYMRLEDVGPSRLPDKIRKIMKLNELKSFDI